MLQSLLQYFTYLFAMYAIYICDTLSFLSNADITEHIYMLPA